MTAVRWVSHECETRQCHHCDATGCLHECHWLPGQARKVSA